MRSANTVGLTVATDNQAPRADSCGKGFNDTGIDAVLEHTLDGEALAVERHCLLDPCLVVETKEARKTFM